MKRKITFLSAAFMLLAFLAFPLGMRGQTTTLVSGSGTSDYSIPDGWSSSGTVAGGSYLKFDDGTITSPEFEPHNGLSFTYSVATFGSGTNHPLTIRILNASTDAVIVETTTATPTSSTYITTGSPLSLGDVTVAFKIQMYGPTGKGVRLRNYSVTGTPAGDTPTQYYISVSPDAISVDSEYHISGYGDDENLGMTTDIAGSDPSVYEVQYSDSENGTYSSENPAWFQAWVGYTTSFNVGWYTEENALTTQNECYFKVYNSANDVYSNAVHVTQAGATPPTPETFAVSFELDGGTFVPTDVFTDDNVEVEAGTYALPSATKEGYTFDGWNDGNETYEGGENYTISADVEFTAQWTENTTPTPGGGEVVDVLNRDFTGVTGSSYANWSGKTGTSGAVYAGNSAGGNSSIQLRSSNNNSGIITTTSAGNVTKVTVTWNNNTSSGRTLNVYGKNSAYSAASDLYGNNAGTLIGTIVCGTSTELNITDDYEFIGVRSASGAMYLNEVDITWASSTPAAVATPTFNPASGQEFGNEGLQVTIACETSGASIYYTLDGSTPDNQSTLYESAISLTQTTTIKAIAYDGTNFSSVANATYTYVDPDAPGTENNPYTVAEARAAIDAGAGTQGVYATGIVSQIVTPWGQNNYQNITFNLVDEVGDEVFLQAFRCVGDQAPEVAVNDVVVVYGNLTYYANQGIYEFAQGCQVVSLTHPAVTVEAPTFNPAAGTYESNFELTISCATVGATIYYTTDGTEPNNESNEYTVALNIASTTTIKAIAYDGNNYSNVATATYHINSAGNAYTVTEALNFPAYQYPANGIYVHGIVSTAPTQAPTNNGELTYFISIDGEATNELEVYKGKGLEQAAFTAQDDIQVGDIVTIYGNVQIYNNIIEFASGNYLVDFERPAAPAVASITVTPATVNEDANEHDGTLDLAYENLTITEMGDFDIQYYDAQGEEIDEPDWISSEVNEKGLSKDDAIYEVTYVIAANNGEARTAYFKVYALYDETNLVYSNIVTINQAEYVAPALDYAELPFSFDGGRNDIETTDGLTQEGLDSDYNSSPKLKFNTTGDWVILKINERPGKLTYNIKGNGFSDGTFTVQTSEDGVTYTDLEAYTELGNTQHEEFTNLGENVRYIKWIYTEKVNGNVALGNITLAEYVAVPSITVDLDYIEVTATGEDDYVGINYENLEIAQASDFGIQFYNANGEELNEEDEPDWMTAEVTTQPEEEGYFVYYVIDDNDGEARSAYFKVYALNGEDFVYSNLVTINQEEYVAPATNNNFALFTGELVEGDYVVYYDGYAMKNTVENNRLSYEEVTPLNDVITTEDATIIWHIAPIGNYWTIYNSKANAYAASTGAKNKAQMLEDGTDDKALWTVDGTEVFEFVNKANSNASVNANLRNNGTYGFACYATSTGGALTLYKRDVEPETYTLEINGYGENEGGYYLIASPVYVNPETTGMTQGDFDLYWFDQNQVTEEWRNYEASHFNLVPGKGYLYAHKTDTILTFAGTPYSGDGIIKLVKNEDAVFSGWNLVGNPFSQTAYIDRDYYTMKEDGSEIVAADEEDGSVEPMHGIFVIADEDNDVITFDTVSGMSSNVEEKVVINVTNNRGIVDRAIVRFGEGRQLPKFQLKENSTKVYIPQGTGEYAVVRSVNQGDMPVNFKASEEGTYTFSVNTGDLEVEYLHLIDNMTGADVDLLRTPSYTFDANTTDFASRFRLVFSANGVDDNTESSNASFAFYNGSEWVISNTGAATLQVVDVMGRVLSTESINGNATANVNQVAGIYMLRLVNGDNVRVQKIVVK